MNRLLLTTVAALMMAMASLGAASDNPMTQRNTTYGPVRGVDDTAASGTLQWKGIPFAAPPTGARRWGAPADPEPWRAVRDATRFAAACVQTGRLYGPGRNNRYDATIGDSLGKTVGEEDCLYLNIWQPSGKAQTPLPVVVWVHGGSNITGYAADPVYDGATLARTAQAGWCRCSTA